MFADRVRVKFFAERDPFDRIKQITCTNFAILQEVYNDDQTVYQQAGRIPLFPGRFEVDINGKSITIENTDVSIVEGGGGGLSAVLDPSRWTVNYKNILGDLDDPILAWLNKNSVFSSNILHAIHEITVDFNGPEDHWYVAISLFKGRLIGIDSVTEVVLGVSDNVGHLDLFDL